MNRRRKEVRCSCLLPLLLPPTEQLSFQFQSFPTGHPIDRPIATSKDGRNQRLTGVSRHLREGTDPEVRGQSGGREAAAERPVRREGAWAWHV
jgi:hypothetical protein